MWVRRYAAALSMLAMAASGGEAAAHHSFAAEFDVNRPVKLVGEVVKMEFSNPHTWLHVDVTLADGATQTWMIEGGAPNALVRRGWNRDSLTPGERVTVIGYRARDGSTRASGQSVTRSDGSELFMGSAGRGSPTR